MCAYSKHVCNFQNKCLGNKKYLLFLKFCLLQIINEIEQNGRQNVIGDAAKCCHAH